MILARKCRELGSLALENRKDVSITCRFGQLNYIITGLSLEVST
jgi:hypothetical protein